MSDLAQIRIEGSIKATMDEIEFEAVRRLLGPCEKNPSKIAKVLKRSPQYIKEILARRTLDLDGTIGRPLPTQSE